MKSPSLGLTNKPTLEESFRSTRFMRWGRITCRSSRLGRLLRALNAPSPGLLGVGLGSPSNPAQRRYNYYYSTVSVSPSLTAVFRVSLERINNQGVPSYLTPVSATARPRNLEATSPTPRPILLWPKSPHPPCHPPKVQVLRYPFVVETSPSPRKGYGRQLMHDYAHANEISMC